VPLDPVVTCRGPLTDLGKARNIVSAAYAILQLAQGAFSQDNFRLDSGTIPRAVAQTQRLARQNDESVDALPPGRFSCVS